MATILHEFEAANARRLELLEIIAQAADEIGQIDKAMPILRSQALEEDLRLAEEHALEIAIS
jgi:hypothetical protein